MLLIAMGFETVIVVLNDSNDLKIFFHFNKKIMKRYLRLNKHCKMVILL